MWGCVDKVAERNESSGQANRRTIQGGDKDFGMSIECVGDIEVIGNERAEPMPANVGAFWYSTRDRNVCTATV